MGWARFDDGWHDHPKVVEAGLEAAGLWAMCLTWAHRSRRTSPTPGVVPDSVIGRFAGARGKKLAATLERVRLFDEKTPDGWPIHDFDEYLPKYNAEQARSAGSLGGKSKPKSKRTGKQTASEPLSEPLSEPPDEYERTVPRVGTGASTRRNPEPTLTESSLRSDPGATSVDAPTENQRAQAIAKAAYDHGHGVVKFQAVQAIASRCIRAGRWTDEQITTAVIGVMDAAKPITLDTVRAWLEPAQPQLRAVANGHAAFRNPADQSVYDEDLR